MNLSSITGQRTKSPIQLRALSSNVGQVRQNTEPSVSQLYFGNNPMDEISESDLWAIQGEMLKLKNSWKLTKLGYNLSFGGVQLVKIAYILATADDDEAEQRIKQLMIEDPDQASKNWKKITDTLELYLDLLYETVDNSNSAAATRLSRQLPPKNKLLSTFYMISLASLTMGENPALKESILKKFLSFRKEDRDLPTILSFYTEVLGEMPEKGKKEFIAYLSNIIEDAADLRALESLLDEVPDEDKQLILKQLRSIYSSLSKDAETRAQIFSMQQKGYALQDGEYKPIVAAPVQENVADGPGKQEAPSAKSNNPFSQIRVVQPTPDFSSKIVTAVQNALSLKQSEHVGGGLALLNTDPECLPEISSANQTILSDYGNKTGRPVISRSIENLASIEALKTDMLRSKLQGEKPIVAITVPPQADLKTQIAIWRSLKQFEDAKNIKMATLNDGGPVYVGDILYVVAFSQEAMPQSKALAQLLGGLKSRAVNETLTGETNQRHNEETINPDIRKNHSIPAPPAGKLPVLPDVSQSVEPNIANIDESSDDQVRAAIQLALSLQAEEHTGGGLLLLDSREKAPGGQMIRAFAEKEKRRFIEAEIEGADSVKTLKETVLHSKLKGETPVVHIKVSPSADANAHIALWRSLKEFHDTKNTRLPEMNEGNPVYLGNAFFAVSYDETRLPSTKGVLQLYGGVKSRAIKDSL